MELKVDAFTAEDVATMLQVNKNTVYALAKRGDLGSYRVGRKLRFTPEDAQEYINISRNEAGQIAATTKHPKGLPTQDQTLFRVNSSPHSSQFVLAGSNMIVDILANRDKGSAPRVLLDEHLRILEADPLQTKGYTREITSPLVQATMIAKGETYASERVFAENF